MPFTEGHQSPGNPIPSAGWNNMVDEIKRLGTAKLDAAGGTVTGQLTVQQSLAVAGTASTAGAAINGNLTVSGPASLASAAVSGGVTVQGAASVNGTATLGSARVGAGAGGPQDTMDVAGVLRVGAGANQLRFTSGWTGFPDTSTSQAEISNDTGNFKRLMIVGNKSNSRANTPRMVGLWDVVTIGSDGSQGGRLEVNGQSCAFSFCNLSDGRLKTDVAPIADPLRQLSRLRGVSFRWREDGSQLRGPDGGLDTAPGAVSSEPNSGKAPPRLGVVAQEVAEVFPELISTVGDEGHLGVDNGGLTAVLIEAVKQLAASNDELRRRVTALEATAGAPATQ